jgi:CBS domain-containing protein
VSERERNQCLASTKCAHATEAQDGLPVVSEAGALVGIITYTDILRSFVAPRSRPREAGVEHVALVDY